MTMEVTKAIEVQHFTKEIPYLTIKLPPSEVRELYKSILNGGDNTNFSHAMLETLTEFLSDYDSGKYDRLTRINA